MLRVLFNIKEEGPSGIPVRMDFLFLFFFATFAPLSIAKSIPGGINNLEDPSQYISLVWDNLAKVNEAMGKPVIGNTYYVPDKVEKGTSQIVAGTIRTWQIVFNRAICDNGTPSKENCRPKIGIDNSGIRYAVTLKELASTNFEQEWSAVPAMSDDEIQLWEDIAMINTELPGNSLYYYIPGNVYLAKNSGENEKKYGLSMLLTACRKARDTPTIENCPPVRKDDGSGIKFYELTRIEEKGAVHFVKYTAVETAPIVH